MNVSTGKKSVSQTAISTHPAGTAVPTKRGTGLSGGTDEYDDKIAGAYAYYPKNTVELPYLPDPMAIGIAIVGYDVTGAEVLSHTEQFLASGLSWHRSASACRSCLRRSRRPRPHHPPSSSRAGSSRSGCRRRPSCERSSRRSSWRALEGICDLGLDGRAGPDAGPRGGGARWPALDADAVPLAHPDHAVQQPLLVPDMTKVTVSRKLGQTFASFDGPILNHARSTGRLDVFAHWTEDVDLIGDGLR